ncbi:unnamed protein product [Bursaphelenchus okinawaensis]|uniref:G-protein coupled receptors family 1 profile domain-containing protein n=1 Tax=Bursaphelenchus okinawaensis TaxID=465554 RepID=A0A811KLL8_9BILA|nr:unnamed protein product [Bursaphelenchus okinawaensis]CAG9107463.1 unnamed protein product [Bursaphelenchus okinawaensis]
MEDLGEEYIGYVQNEYSMPLRGHRRYIAYVYIFCNSIGFLVNGYVLYVVGPLLFVQTVKVPKSILFYILTLCVSDLMTMIGMLLLVTEIVLGTWKFSAFACTSYLLFDSMNKFMAPIIVVLISRTCYATICLDKKKQERAASLKYAIPYVIASISVVLMLLWPVFAYSEVSIVPATVNHTIKEVTYLKKCGFLPPPSIEIGFSLVACMLSYAIPLFGIIFWYMSVPLFLRKRAENTLTKGGNGGTADVAVRKVITTVLVLTVVYVLCWTPYWISLFLHRIFPNLLAFSNKNIVFIFYMIHMLPYISCCAYPLIFTVMNRAIQKAHAEVMNSQRRRFKSITEDVTRHIRDALSFRLLNRDNNLFPRSSISVATCTTAQRMGIISPNISPRVNLRPQGSSLNLLASANSVSFSDQPSVNSKSPPSTPSSPMIRSGSDDDMNSETVL